MNFTKLFRQSGLSTVYPEKGGCWQLSSRVHLLVAFKVLFFGSAHQAGLLASKYLRFNNSPQAVCGPAQSRDVRVNTKETPRRKTCHSSLLLKLI